MSRLVLGPASTVAVFLLDQVAKHAVTGPLAIDHTGASLDLTSFFALRFVPNLGISLGLFPADGPVMRWLLVVMTALIAIGVSIWMHRERGRPEQLALGLVLGGALGNILDRVRFGYVVDFADFHLGEWRPFLVFNVADAAITIGVLVLLGRALLTRAPSGAAMMEK